MAVLAAGYIRLVLATSRITFRGIEIPQSLWDRDEPFILAFWHGQMLLLVHSWQTKRPVRMLISQNFDGEMIAAALERFNIMAVRGSSDKGGKDKGGKAAIRAMMKATKNGESIGFTPDGPKGPRMRAKEGIVVVARLAGVPIVPVVAAASRRRVIGSWDRFLLVLPFTRGVIIWGDPIHVPRDIDDAGIEAVRAKIETTLNQMSREASALMGCPPVEPAAP